MHWWQSPFSSPSSSKHPQHSNDNVLTKIFPRRALRSQRRCGRSAKLRYRSADDTAPDDCDRRNKTLWRYPSARTSTNQPRSSSPSRPSPVVPPQPLPLPVLEELLRRDATAATSPSTSWSPTDLPLPSPKQRPNKGQEDKDREKGGDGATPTSNNACHGCQRHEEHANTRQPVKAPQELNGIERYRDAYLFNIPNSAPSSPFSSPSRSPQRIPSHIFTSPVFKSPKVFQAWSAPEMRPLDTHVGSAFSYQMSPEGKSAYSVESSPLHSPRVSPRRYPRSPGGPTSPTAHRLPLPPGATSPTKIPNVSPIIMPIKSQWQKGKLIGRGTFGSVYVASNRETGALCAMKEVELFFDDPKSAESIKQLEQEIKVLSNLQHPNIVQYYGSEVDGDRLYIYLEYVHPGSINKYIHDHCGVMSESVVRSFTRHILSGLAYLHSTRTIHRDIKCANLLVDVSGVVKLADFGMAKHLAGPAAANLSLKGSPYWMAPELLQSMMQKDASSDLALAVDIWSLGCTIIEMLNGKPPWSEYEGAAAMFKVLRETPPVPEILSAEGKDFLHCCFRRNPAERPSAIKLLEHRFLSTSQMDVLPCTQVFNGMSLMDNAECSREPRTYELEPWLQSQDIHKTRGGKVAKRLPGSSFTPGSFSPIRSTDGLAAKLPN